MLNRFLESKALVIICLYLFAVLVTVLAYFALSDTSLFSNVGVGSRMELPSQGQGSDAANVSDGRHHAFLIREEVRVSRDKEAKAAQRRRQFFADRGWSSTNSEAPDERLVSLDPSLVDSQTGALLVQLRTNSMHDSQLSNAVLIAKSSTSSELRQEVIRSLIRRNSDSSRDALIEIYRTSDVDDDRLSILLGMHPVELSDGHSSWLLEQFNEQQLDETNRHKIAANLIVVATKFESNLHQLPRVLLDGIDVRWHGLMSETYDLIMRGKKT